MSEPVTIQGLSELKVAIAKHKVATALGTEVGMKRAGLFLQRESQKIVPIDQDILRPSADYITRMEGSGFAGVMTVGYETEYAIYVHEDLEARHKPGTSAKYLEKPMREGYDVMAEIIKDAVEEFSP